MAAVTADQLYQMIKEWEGTFPLPAPYVTVDVGTFDAATGAFQGLKTEEETDPEPIEHGAHDHPKNPPPKFVGNLWEEVTIDSQWRQTIKTVPAPKVSQAPVLLRFEIANASTAWSVTIGGFTTTAPAGQTSLSVSIWDRTEAAWTIQAGAVSYSDELMIQRPGALPGLGAFTIPVIPVGIVYAPPVDSLKSSVATYGVGDTIGTTTTYQFSTDKSETVPQTGIGFETFTEFKSALDVASQVLAFGKGNFETASKALADISSAIGTLTETTQSGTVETEETSITVTDTSSETISSNTSGGGPGVGDVIIFLKDVQVAWLYGDGRLRLCPFGWTKVVKTAADLQTSGISKDDQQNLRALDPFVAGGPDASLPPDRFTVPTIGDPNLEYGGGVNIDQKFSETRDTKTTTTEKTYTTSTSSWDPGPLLKLFGIGSDKSDVTTSVTNATASDVSSTVTLEANLFAGPKDNFAVTIWYDQLFGTWAFQQHKTASSPLVSGDGARPGDTVKLEAGKRVYVTVADKKGHFAFRAKDIPNGAASVVIGNEKPAPVKIAAGHVAHVHGTPVHA